MAMNNIEKVLTVFKGIGNREPNLAIKYAEAKVLGQNIFFDIFKFEEGLIVQHYDLFTAVTPPNESVIPRPTGRPRQSRIRTKRRTKL